MKISFATPPISTIVLLFVSASCSFAEQQQSWDSPAGDFRVVRSGTPEGDTELLVISTHEPEKRSLLYRYSRSGDVIISPSGSFIAFNYQYSSTDSTVLLFERATDTKFQLLSKFDLPTVVSKFYTTATKEPLSLDHFYLQCLGWSANSKAILLKAYGHGKDKTLSGWFCVFSVPTQEMSLSLNDLNQ